MPESKDADDFQQKVLETERIIAERMRLEELHSAVCKKVADLVDIEIPEYLYRTVGENEYQAELLTSQANVSCENNLSSHLYMIRKGQKHFQPIFRPSDLSQSLFLLGLSLNGRL